MVCLNISCKDECKDWAQMNKTEGAEKCKLFSKGGKIHVNEIIQNVNII